MLRVPNARELMAGLTYGRIRPTSLSSGLRYPVGTASRVRPACSPAVPTAALIGFGAARFFRRSAVECPVITVVSGRQMLHQGSHHFAPRLEGGLDVRHRRPRHLLAQRQPSAVNYVSQNMKPSASVTGTPVLSPPPTAGFTCWSLFFSTTGGVLYRGHRQRAASNPRHLSQRSMHTLPRTAHANDHFILF
jgi:hypothetical protein